MKYHPDYSSRFRILKGGKISLVVSALIGSVTILSASPTGGQVTSGSASIAQHGTTTNITQSSQKASINWQSFSVASNETVNFNQPNASSITLNRVVGNERSVINGAMNANGQVWLLNSSGVLFGKNASINTAGLLATTAELSDIDFQNGNYNFKNSSSNSVINEGTITISDAGLVILASNEVRNSGTIKAIKGKVHLVGASDYTINLNGNSLVNLKVDKGVLDAMIENSGTIIADGGEIYLTTNAVDELLKGVVNNTGIIEANSLDGLTGYVELFAHGGTAEIGGNIEAKDGFVETSGKYFNFFGADIQAGEWLIDPVDITIDTTLANAIVTALGSGDVTIETDQSDYTDVDTSLSGTNSESGTTGDITVASDITWATDKKLTLTAANAINVNATIENTNTTDGGVYFNALNTTDKVVFGENGKVIINNASQLQWINRALAGKYELGTDIDLAGVTWTPIGDSTNKFTGTFDGVNHIIDNLTITNDQSNSGGIGFFGNVYDAKISNVGITNANIQSQAHYSGILAGQANGVSTSINNVYSTGSITGETKESIGGLIGGLGGALTNSYSTASVNGGNYIGGLVGSMYSSAYIDKSYATGDVTGTAFYIGGLVGIITETGESFIRLSVHFICPRVW